MSLIRGVYKLSKGISKRNYLNNIIGSSSITSLNNNNVYINQQSQQNNIIYKIRNYSTSTLVSEGQNKSIEESNNTNNNTNNSEVENINESNANGTAEIPYQFLALNEEQWNSSIGKDIPKRSENYFNLIEGRTTLLRKPAFQSIQWLSKMKDQRFFKESPSDYCLVLDGPNGVGKSMTLAQIIFWAKQQEWLVVYIPDSDAYINRGSLTHFDPNPLIFGQNEIASNFIKNLIELNQEKLKVIPLKTKFTISLTGWKSSPDKTLYDLLSSQKFDAASEVLYYFKNELNAIHEYPVLVAIDGFNYFYRNSEFGDMYDPKSTFRSLPTDRLVPASIFKNITSHNITNGVVVATTTSVIPKKELLKTIPEESILQIENYSLYEFKLFVNFLHEMGYYDKAPPRETVEYLWQMSGGNPKEAWSLLSVIS